MAYRINCLCFNGVVGAIEKIHSNAFHSKDILFCVCYQFKSYFSNDFIDKLTINYFISYLSIGIHFGTRLTFERHGFE